jgi:glycosyltransferase involved in cell wall biosynthesis
MRIAFAMINCNRRDGSARPVNEVAERLADRGHEVHLYARKVEDLDLSKVKWHRVPGPVWPEVADFTSYHCLANSMISNKAYDIVHSIGCNTLRANVITIQNVQPAKWKILDRLREGEKVSSARRLTRWLYLKVTCEAERRLYTANKHRRSPMFLPVSRGVERELRAHYEIGGASVRIIPNAADTKTFKPVSDERKTRWRAQNGLLAEDFVAVFSGGEWARKGLDLAIRALGKVDLPEVKLYVAGEDPDRQRFAALAKEAGVAERVIFGGFRKDVAEVLASSDLFLMPSRYEAFSLATIEAAACGLPVVVSRINGAEDFIQPGETGEFIEHDPEQIAGTLKLLARQRGRCQAMGVAARKLVEAHYTWDHIADQTEAAYRAYLDPREKSKMQPETQFMQEIEAKM